MKILALALGLLIPASSLAQPATLRCIDAQGNLVLTQGAPPPGSTCTGAPGLAPAPGDPRRWEREAAEQERESSKEKMRETATKPRSASDTQCYARAKAWVATVPPGSYITKYDMARAIGADCDVDALLRRVLTNLEAAKAALEECRRRWAANGDTAKVYDLKRPGVRQDMWLDMARAAGNECADLLLR